MEGVKCIRIILQTANNITHIKLLKTEAFTASFPKSIIFPDGLKAEYIKESRNGFLIYREVEHVKASGRGLFY